MLKTLLLLGALSLQNPAAAGTELGIVAGVVSAPGETNISQPVRVILLSPQYATLWTSDVQKRLDVYWERYKPAFAQRKEYFLEVSKIAYMDALDFVLNRMQRDQRIRITDFIQTTGAEGKFEFKNIPVGEYKIVAVGRIGGVDMLWQESVDVIGSTPQFVRLKKTVP